MVYFASDIHLGGGDKPEACLTERRFLAWLDRVSADAGTICLAGDIFDFWFEKGDRIPDGFDRVLEKFREVTARGIGLVFLPGNHDMWLNGYFERACGMRVCNSPQVFEFYGKRIFVAHGDNMNIAGKPLLRLLNACFRSRGLRRVFELLVPYRWILRFGRWWSAGSRRSHGKVKNSAAVTEPLIGYARRYAAEHRVDHFVFGHMHFPRDYREGTLHTVHLGEWSREPWYAVLDGQGRLTLEKFEL